MKQSALQESPVDTQGFFENLGEMAPIGLVLGVVVLFYLFNDQILHDYRLVMATVLLVLGVSLLSWMRPSEYSDDVEVDGV